MNMDEALQYCYDNDLSLDECEALLAENGYTGVNPEWIADRLEEIYIVEEGK